MLCLTIIGQRVVITVLRRGKLQNLLIQVAMQRNTGRCNYPTCSAIGGLQKVIAHFELRLEQLGRGTAVFCSFGTGLQFVPRKGYILPVGALHVSQRPERRWLQLCQPEQITGRWTGTGLELDHAKNCAHQRCAVPSVDELLEVCAASNRLKGIPCSRKFLVGHYFVEAHSE